MLRDQGSLSRQSDRQEYIAAYKKEVEDAHGAEDSQAREASEHSQI